MRTMTITGHIHISSLDLATIITQVIITTLIGILTGDGDGILGGMLVIVIILGIAHGTTLTGDIRHGIIIVGIMVIGTVIMMAFGLAAEGRMMD